MPAGGHLGIQVYIQNSAPLNPSPGDFWYDTSAAGVLNFRASYGSWIVIDIPTTALDTLSNSVSVLSQAVSVISQSLSVLSQTHSVLSAAHSVVSATLVSVQSQVSAISAQLASVQSNVSATSATLASVQSNVSAISATLASVQSQVSAISAQVASVQSLLQVFSANISTLSQAHSVVSAGLGALQMRWVSIVQGVSSTAAAGAAISGLSISVAAGGIYHVEGAVVFQVSVIPCAIGLVLNFPAMVSAQAGGDFTGHGGIVGGGGGHGQLTSVVRGTFQFDGSDSVAYSAILSAASTYLVRLDAMFNVSTAGTIQMNARVSATGQPVNIQPGSYLRAHRIV